MTARQDKIVSEMRKLLRAGFTHREIAQLVGCGKGSVGRWLNPDIAEKRRRFEQEWRQKKARERMPDAPSVPYVRCLEGKEPPTFRMVR